MASSSSSSSSTRRWKYDVFLSFRGLDTRKGITNEICDRLNRIGIKTFMDDHDDQGLQVGDTISSALKEAIKESRFAIVILSQNYAFSAWCLEELRVICLSMEENNILPLFFEVNPSDVRYQRGSYHEAFCKHDTSQRHEPEKVNQWRAALEKVALISGWNSDNFKTHRELVNKIVEDLRSKVPLDPIETTGHFQAYEATKEAMGKVMKALTDDKITAVGVHGMGGVGKTTMVKHVAAQACKNGTFNHWIIAAISQSLDLKKVQGTLADKLGFKFEEETEDGRADRLHKEIMKKEKLLIILDDVWKSRELSEIGIPDYKELQTCSSKVLVTTRNIKVCTDMNCEEKIALKLLSEEDSLTLFMRNAGTIPFKSPTFEGVVKRVAGECKGLPIALIAVARALRGEDQGEWEKAAQRLEESQHVNPNHEEAELNAFDCLRLSYDYLKKEEYKSFFLLCCLFPEDWQIEREVLFRYAIGKGLFRDAETIYEARGKADTVLKHLIYSSLLLEDEKYPKGDVSVHDVVRDTALNIAKSEEGHRFLVRAGSGSDDWLRQLHEDCTAISLMQNNCLDLPPQMVCPKLQILSLNNNYFLQEIPETFFQNLNELRVLDLSWTDSSSLSQSFGHLTNLRALCLDGCDGLNDISMVGKLTKLEVLSMRCIKLVELSREIGNLTNLKVLDISEGKIDRIPSKLISRLQNLEELYLKCGFWEWVSKVDEGGDETNAGFDEVTGLSRLKVLEVLIGDPECIPKLVELNPNWVKFYICIGKDEKLSWPDSSVYGDTERIITLRLDSISNFPDWFLDAVMNKAEMLLWEGCPQTGLIDVFVEYECGRLHELKNLNVSFSYDIDQLMNTPTRVPNERIPSAPVLENLETLKLWNVEFLPARPLCNLKILEVGFGLYRGTVLLPSKLLQGLPNLEELKCDYVVDIKYVFGCEALLETQQSKLRKIELSSLNRLRSICEGPAPPAMFQNLQSLSIQQCTLQGSLFTADVAQNLGQLRFLDLCHCRFLERIVEASNKKINFQKLKDLRLTNLPRLDYESTAIDFECPSLEDFYLWDCPKFLVSVSDFNSYNQVQHYDDFKFFWEREMEMSDHESEEEDLSDQESEEQDSEYESEEQDLSDQESEEQDSDKPDESGEGEVSVCGG